MPEYRSMFIRVRKYIFYLLAIFVLGWGFTSYQEVFLGLILGTGLSLINLWLLVKRMDRFGKQFDKGKVIKSLGFFSRVAVAILGVFIALEYPEYFHLISVIIGLMATYVVIMIDYFIENRHLFSNEER